MDNYQLVNHTHIDETDEDEILSGTLNCAIAWCTLALSILGILTNAISIFIYTHHTMKSPVNVLLAGLSAMDLCLSAGCIPSFAIPVLSTCHSTLQSFMSAYCLFYSYPITMMAQTASVFTFLVIGFERWIAVCHPLKARWSSVERSYRALIAVCIAAVSYNAIRFFEFELQFNEDGEPRMEPLLKNDTIYPAYMPVYYVTMYLITHFIIPFAALISLNILMISSIMKARRQRLMLGRKQKSEHKTTIMMGLVVFVFVVCNTLPFVVNFVEAVDANFFHKENTQAIGWALVDFSNMLVVVNTSTTAFIYYCCSQRYRRLFLITCYRLFCGLKCLPFNWYVKLHSSLSNMDKGYSLAIQSTAATTSTNLCSTLSPITDKQRLSTCMFDERGPKLSICSTRRPLDLNTRRNALIEVAHNGDNVTI